MIIFDAHLDLAWNAIDWNRDLLLPVAEIRRREREQGLTDKGRGCNTVSFPELRRGQVAVFIATLLAFFFVLALFVAACDRMIGSDEEAFADRTPGTGEKERLVA